MTDVSGVRARPSGTLFLLPVAAAGHGPVAAWISTASWAGAAARRWGAAWVVGPDGPVDLDGVAATGSRPALRPPARRTWRQRVPAPVKTAVKDLRRVRAGRAFAPEVGTGPWTEHDLAFVWQRHEPFVTALAPAARRLGCPSVLFVPAPVAWEARRWGVARPGWARAFTRFGELPALRSADVVACGSTVVASVVADLGVDASRIVVTPNGVDMERFAPSPDRKEVRAELDLDGRFVMGWCGSFRGFHALDLLVTAAARARTSVPDLTLLLVGDGPERPAVEDRCRELGVPVVCTGTRPHHQIGRLLSAMDVAVVATSTDGADYHYSPLKLWEYLACGVATVAPAAGDPARRLRDGVEALLVEPGSADAVADAVAELAADEPARRALGARARAFAEAELSWDAQIELLAAALPRASTSRR